MAIMIMLIMMMVIRLMEGLKVSEEREGVRYPKIVLFLVRDEDEEAATLLLDRNDNVTLVMLLIRAEEMLGKRNLLWMNGDEFVGLEQELIFLAIP